MKPDSFLITKDQQSNPSNRCCKPWNTTTQKSTLWSKIPSKKLGRLWQITENTNFTTQWCQEFPHLLQRIHPPCQHVEVVQGGDGGGQVALGMVQLLDIPGDFLHLASQKESWLNIKPQQWYFQEIRSHSLLFGIAEVAALWTLTASTQ